MANAPKTSDTSNPSNNSNTSSTPNASKDTKQSGQSNPSDSKKDEKNVYGEGNYEASRQYNDATKKFVESGKVEQAAEDAKPADEKEAKDMERAEEIGRSHAKEEDPALKRGSKKP